MGLTDLVAGFKLLGLEPPAKASEDISYQAIADKLTNASIVQAMNGSMSLPYIEQSEWCANLLDSYSEGGGLNYLLEAQYRYEWILATLPKEISNRFAEAVGAVFNYFSYERFVAYRIGRGDAFVYEEIAEYLLRRGSDSILVAFLLVELDGIEGNGIVTGFRVRQGLWDLADDVRDLEQDKRTLGANILLLSQATPTVLKSLAGSLRKQALELLPDSSPLAEAIEQEYREVCLVV